MKSLRKWMRILHRDIGFFFIGTSIIYGISGIAMNHVKDWNPSYYVSFEDFETTKDLKEEITSEENILALLDDVDNRTNYKVHTYLNDSVLKIYLDKGSVIELNTNTGKGHAELLRKRAFFYEVNYLHYNPNIWWTWFSDIFSVSLIFFAISSVFMVRGKKGAWGIGGIYIVFGIIIPIVFLIIY